jgi:hypothetical protein
VQLWCVVHCTETAASLSSKQYSITEHQVPDCGNRTINNRDVKNHLGCFWTQWAVVRHVDNQIIVEGAVHIVHAIKLIQLTVVVVQHKSVDAFVIVSTNDSVLDLQTIQCC